MHKVGYQKKSSLLIVHEKYLNCCAVKEDDNPLSVRLEFFYNLELQSCIREEV